MGNTSISGIGKIFPQMQNVEGVGKSGDGLNAAFAEVMSQMSGMPGQKLTAGGGHDDASFMRTEDVSADAAYDRYQRREYEVRETGKSGLAQDGRTEEKLEEFNDSVKEILQDELGVTEEDIEKAMETLGLTVADFMNPKQLAALVAELTGAEDMSSMLVSSEFLTVLTEVGTLSESLLQELGIPQEQLQALLQDVTAAEAETGSTDVQENSEVLQSDDAVAEKAAESAKVQTAMSGADSEAVQITKAQEAVQEEAPDTDKLRTEEPADAAEEAPAKEGDVADAAEPVVEKEQNTKEQNAFDRQNPQTGQEALTANQRTPETGYVPQTEGAEQFSQQLDTADIIRQISEFTRVTFADRATTMEMQLNPQNLGKIYLELTSKNGVVSARIAAQNEAVREVLESQLVELRQNLNQSGVKVDAVEVTVGSHEFERNLEQDARRDGQEAETREKAAKQTRRLKLDELDALSGVMTEEETLVAQMMAEQGNSVDFTA